MIAISLQQIVEIVEGRFAVNGVEVSDKPSHDILKKMEENILSVSTDSRSIDINSLFIAIVGETFDGHNFCQQATNAGAKALLVEHFCSIEPHLSYLPVQIIVTDTRLALGRLAAWVHQQAHQHAVTLAITGSCGKTTVKEMVAAILNQKGKVLFTAGNFNNDIGVPLTLLRSSIEDRYAIIELGANHIGEIAYTTQLVKPDIALVNNVAAAHLEGFGSIEGVKKAKGEIFQSLKPGAVAIVSLENKGDECWSELLSQQTVLTFAFDNPMADYYASEVKLDKNGAAKFMLHTPQGSIVIQLNIIGLHNVTNAAAAAAAAIAAGATLNEVAQGLAHLPKVKGRVEVNQLSTHLKLIDDSYNASVPAMKAAVDLLSTFNEIRWLILGNMAELGDESLALHRQLGEYAAQFNFEYVLTYGDDARIISQLCKGVHFDTHMDMISYIELQLSMQMDKHHILLIKGANSAGMSKIATALKEKH